MKNKGFTLIEILVVIVLITSITVIAIVSFNNVSSSKKKEAYEDVKKQVEEAGEEYYKANEYLLSKVEDNSDSYARVSLGKLVSEDYLNKVTNPVTGKTLSDCSYVEVTKKNGGYIYTFNENSDKTSCNVSNIEMITESGAPLIYLSMDKPNGNNNWYKINGNTNVSVTIESLKDSSKITDIKYCTKENSNYCNTTTKLSSVKLNFVDTSAFNSDTKSKVLCYSATNDANKTATACITAKVDKTKPSCDAKTDKSPINSWFNLTTGKPTITFTGKDNTSGIYGSSSVTNNNIKEGINNEYSNTFSDNAGNKNSCNISINYDATAPTCEVNISGNYNNSRRDDKWYTGNVKIKGSCNDKLSGCTSSDVSKNYNDEVSIKSESPGNVSDNAGNVTKCGSKEFGIEKSVSISFNASKTNESASYNPKGTSNGQAVFTSGACGFGQCSNINCRMNDGVTVCPTAYYAKSCMYVSSYDRWFNVSGVSIGNNVLVKADGETDSEGMKRIETHARYNCTLTSTYNAFECGNSSGGLLNVSAHVYQYTSPAGNKSNTIQLFVDYGVNCGYKYN